MRVRAIRTRVFREREDIIEFVSKQIPRLENGSVLAVTSKIVALSEGRVADAKDKKKLIKKESKWALQTHSEWWWTEKDGALLVNAGIDDSNADGKLVLLPKDSFASAKKLRETLKKHYKLQRLGVIITDSRISPMRAGVTGLALGYAGFKGVRDYRGKKDLFGRKLKVTVTDVADSLATVAALVMGEGAERQPLAIIEDAPVEFVEKVNRREVVIAVKEDMYAALFKRGRGKRKI
jgi:dihydrofolate synthase / folylpolyglutamate synthase